MSNHINYETIEKECTKYGITITDAKEYTEHDKYVTLVLTGTYKNHVAYDGKPINPSPSHPVRINFYYNDDKGIVDGACSITTPEGIQECDLHDRCKQYHTVFGSCSPHAAVYNIAVFFHNSL